MLQLRHAATVKVKVFFGTGFQSD